MKSAAVVTLALTLILVDLAAQSGTIAGRVLVRERENGDHSLLIGAASPQGIDRLQFNLPSRVSLETGWLPNTWTFTLDGRRVTITGQPLPEVHVRLNARPAENLIGKFRGKELELDAALASGGPTRRIKLKVEEASPPTPRLAWIRQPGLTLPPEYTPGAPILATPGENFADGVWMGGGPLSPAPVSPNDEAAVARVREAAARIDNRKMSRFFRDLAMKQTPPDPPLLGFDLPPQSFRYFDHYLELLMEGLPTWKEVPGAACERTISGGTPLAFAGQNGCVSGCFPSTLGGLEEAARLLMLDDQRPLVPQAGSPTTIVFRVPPDTPPGPHVITWKAGGNATGRLQLGVLQLEGTIDQNELWRGQSTTMRLRIVGSDQPLPLTIINRTSTTIEIEGGERQVITTPGGADNAVTRQVRGIMKGNFAIDYSLDQPPCGTGR